MGTVQKLAKKIKAGLKTVLPKLRQTVINKLALAVEAMIEAQMPNTIKLPPKYTIITLGLTRMEGT